MHYARPWRGGIDERYAVRWLSKGVQRMAFSAIVPSDPEQELVVPIPVAPGTQPVLVDLPEGIPFAAMERLFPQEHGLARGGGGGATTYARAPRVDRRALERDIVAEGERAPYRFDGRSYVVRVRCRARVGFFERLFEGDRHLWGVVDFAPPDGGALFIPSATNIEHGGRVIVFAQADYPRWANAPMSLRYDEGFRPAEGALPHAPGLLDPSQTLSRGERNAVREDLGVT